MNVRNLINIAEDVAQLLALTPQGAAVGTALNLAKTVAEVVGEARGLVANADDARRLESALERLEARVQAHLARTVEGLDRAAQED